jgi:hypothetical protein
MQEKITIYWLLINPLKMLQSSNIWEHQIKILFINELRADSVWGVMYATVKDASVVIIVLVVLIVSGYQL